MRVEGGDDWSGAPVCSGAVLGASPTAAGGRTVAVVDEVSIAFGCRPGAGFAHIVGRQQSIGAPTRASDPPTQHGIAEQALAITAATGERIAKASATAIARFITTPDVAGPIICSRGSVSRRAALFWAGHENRAGEDTRAP